MPPRVNVRSSPSASDTDIIATSVWFSITWIVEATSIDGESLTGSMVTFTSALEVLSACVRV